MLIYVKMSTTSNLLLVVQQQKTITKDDVRRLKIFMPPLEEQNKIAQILSTWDQVISTTEKLLENSQQQKKL